MKRVSIVNLAGRAYHVEEEGVAAIDAWLGEARTRLAADPDRDELLADFERAIADKCEARVGSDRDVVTGEHVAAILTGLGTVEPAGSGAEPQAADTEPLAAADGPRVTNADTPWRERRLYRLTGDGEAQIAGVCAGLAAYLNMDVTVVRVLTVILTLATGGGAAIAYIAMALLVPEANSPEQRAAVRGYGETAQEMMSRARDNAGPALATLGSTLTAAWTAIARFLRWTLLAVTWVLLAAWAVAVAWIITDGAQVLSAFDDGTSRWLVALWVTCAAWIAVSIPLAIANGLRATTPSGRDRPRRHAPATNTAWIASVVVAALGLWAIPATESEQFRSLDDGQGRIELFDETFCLYEDENGRPDKRCEPGDIIVD